MSKFTNTTRLPIGQLKQDCWLWLCEMAAPGDLPDFIGGRLTLDLLRTIRPEHEADEKAWEALQMMMPEGMDLQTLRRTNRQHYDQVVSHYWRTMVRIADRVYNADRDVVEPY